MKNKKLLLFGLGLAVASSATLYLPTALTESKNAQESSYEEKGEKEDFNGALEFYMGIRKNPVTGRVDIEDVLNAQAEVRAAEARNKNVRSATTLNWTEVGPSNVGGRIRALHFDRNNSSIIYAGGVAGGLWKTTNNGQSWSKVFETLDNMAVTSIAQAPNGDMYLGTGEGLYAQYGTGAGGMLGSGIFKSTDGGNSFSQLASTVPSAANSTSATWAAVNEIAISPVNASRIYAATNRGLMISDDAGQSWKRSHPIASNFKDVDVSSDGTVFATINGGVYKSATGDSGTYVNIASGTVDSLPNSQPRYEIAIAPTDGNYIYCSVSDNSGKLKGVYRSTDKGAKWSVIGPGGSASFNPLGSQGDYANAIAVSSTDKNAILVGGLDLYSWSSTTTWTKLSRWYSWAGDPRYVHADIHELKYHPTNGNTFYVGCDGGVFRSTDNGVSFYNRNQGLNITQFYAVATGPQGDVLGGTQDNGSQYIPTTNIAYEVMGGDGGHAELSWLNPEATFQTIYYGGLTRRPTKTSMNSGAEFYGGSARLQKLADAGSASFVTPIRMWESKNDTLSKDSVDFKADRAYAAGEAIVAKSNTSNITFGSVTPVALDSGDVVKVKDLVQNRFVVGFSGSVWMTREALNFGVNPGWAKIANVSGTVQAFAFSEDGNHLFVGSGGRVYRISNLNSMTIKDTLTGEIGNAKCSITSVQIANTNAQTVTSIAVDPRNANNVVVTLGNYGMTNYVYRTNNALSLGTSATFANFTSVMGTTTALPKMPVYGSTIDYLTGTLILGTEYGVWTSDDALTSSDPAWSKSAGFPSVPVFMVRQQTLSASDVSNTGVLYAATHGRGIFKTNSLVGIKDPGASVKAVSGISIYPNPAVENTTIKFNAVRNGDVTIRVFSLNGTLVSEKIVRNTQKGVNTWTMETSPLAIGTYFVKVTGVAEGTSKFVVIK